MSTASAPSRRPWLLTGVVLLLLAAAGVAVYLVWFRSRSDMAGAAAANARGVARMERLLAPEIEQAEQEFEEAVRLAPDWDTPKINLAISLFNQQSSGDRNLNAKVQRARGLFQEVLAKDPENLHAHYCLGMIDLYATQYPQAYEHFLVVSRKDPADAHTWLRLGTTHPNGPRSPEARDCFARALQLNPNLNEARYRLAQAVQEEDMARTQKLFEEHRAFLDSGQADSSEIKYAEMGRYADVIGRDPARLGKPKVGPLPTFGPAPGFRVTLAADARWAAPEDLDPPRRAARDRFGGAIVLFDYDRDGRPDVLLLSAVVTDGKVRDLLLHNDGDGAFSDRTAAAGLAAPRPSLGAAVADYDNDGFMDLVVTGAGEQHLFRNKGDGTFEDVSAAAGLPAVTGVCLGCGWVDLDQDSDLDLVLCRYAATADGAQGFAADPAKAGGGLVVLENVGEAKPGPAKGPLQPLTTRFKADDRIPALVGSAPFVSVVATDADGDRDIDLVVLPDRGNPALILNDRLMRFHVAGPDWPAPTAHPWNGGLAAVVGQADRSDLLLVPADAPPVLLLASGRREFTPAQAGGAALRQGTAVDVDLDGWPDVVGLAADGAPALLHNEEGKLTAATDPFGPASGLPAGVQGVACADLDGDGAPDLLLWAGDGLSLRKNAGNGNKAVLIEPTGLRDKGEGSRTNASGIGAWVVAQSGKHWTAAERTTGTAGLGQSLLPVALGMGKADQAEAVRVRWPDGVIQAELAAASGAVYPLQEKNRKPISCPVLVTWDGERYAFVTDFLGAGSMGELGPDGSARPPRPEESVKIEANQLKARDGKFLVKVTEPMDEVLYLDHFRLDVLDHPAGTGVFPDERFATADPQPTQELLAFRSRIAPKRAADHRGADVTKLVLDRDRRAVEGFHLRSWLGFAEDHALTMDFGDVPAGPRKWVLVLAGWTEYPFPESIYAAERAGVPLNFPVLERLGADGKTWESLGDLGFPAGLPRVMTRPLTDLKPGPCVLRVRTNMQVFWDQVYLAPAEDVGLKVHSLPVERADLAARGFIQEVYPDGRPPVGYDDARTEQVPVTRWEGNLTRTGDVTELLTAADDRFVIAGPGDEVTIRFDGSKLPDLPAGWERSFVLRSRGYSKDAAPFTATGGKVGPLPFRAMKNYPDFGGVAPPATDAARWHTRPAGGPAQPRREGR